MAYIIVAVVTSVLAYSGWKLTSRNAYESAEYSVLKSDGEIELREYPDLMLATTDMTSGKQSDNGSFGRLFKYISGGNEGKQKVAMTTPVFMVPETGAARGQMGFVLPKAISGTNIPSPSGDQVALTKRLGGKFAAIRFSGRLNPQVMESQRETLQEWIDKQGYDLDGEPEVAGYDPPWTPGPFRRNEILIRIRQK